MCAVIVWNAFTQISWQTNLSCVQMVVGFIVNSSSPIVLWYTGMARAGGWRLNTSRRLKWLGPEREGEDPLLRDRVILVLRQSELHVPRPWVTENHSKSRSFAISVYSLYLVFLGVFRREILDVRHFWSSLLSPIDEIKLKVQVTNRDLLAPAYTGAKQCCKGR